MRTKEATALDAFAALSHPTRLHIVEVLMAAGPAGLAAGAIGNAVAAAPSRASFHLAHLERANLIESRRSCRSIIYTAKFQSLSELVEFLIQDCCGGRVALLAPEPGAAAA
jgi:DNA-binding transcriptional ArsR family regulator